MVSDLNAKRHGHSVSDRISVLRLRYQRLAGFVSIILLAPALQAGQCSVTVPPTSTGVIFETDFSQDTGYSQSANGGFNLGGSVPPTGWHGLSISPDSFVDVVNEGINGSNAMRLNYRSANSGRASITLARHLSGNANVGYPELYIRYNMKLPSNFRAGVNGAGLAFWKWGRLWQNTSPVVDNTWTENRVGSGWFVWGLLSSYQAAQGFYGAFADNTVAGNQQLGSNGGPGQYATWYRNVSDPATSDGFLEAVGDGAWEFDDARPGFLRYPNQSYHTIEWRIKLASTADAEDGVFEMWVDGVRLMPFTRLDTAYGAPDRTGIPTVAESSGGFNLISLFDNMDAWANLWGEPGVDGYILINDVVISTERIGHNYVASGSTPLNQ